MLKLGVKKLLMVICCSLPVAGYAELIPLHDENLADISGQGGISIEVSSEASTQNHAQHEAAQQMHQDMRDRTPEPANVMTDLPSLDNSKPMGIVFRDI